MEAPDERKKEGENEDNNEEKEGQQRPEGESDESQQETSSSMRIEPSSSSRGPEGETTENNEANIYRPSLLDRVAASLVSYGMDPANYAENRMMRLGSCLAR